MCKESEKGYFCYCNTTCMYVNFEGNWDSNSWMFHAHLYLFFMPWRAGKKLNA